MVARGELQGLVRARRAGGPVSTTPYPVALGQQDQAQAQNERLVTRGMHARRLLLVADSTSIFAAYVVSLLLFGAAGAPVGSATGPVKALLFLVTIPIWVGFAAVAGLYDHDRTRMAHSTVDELADIIKVVTLGTWVIFPTCWLIGAATPHPARLVVFWALAIVLMAGARATARAAAGHAGLRTQRVLVVGGGEVGQLVGRKLLQHPEYQMELLGFVDARPKERRAELSSVGILGTLEELSELITRHSADRIIVAFSNESHEELLRAIRAARSLDVQVDVVPRLFELVSPRVEIHDIEGLPLVGLSSGATAAPARVAKRVIDVVGSIVLLLATSPVFAYAALRIKRDSRGPVFFRQTRLGKNLHEFTVLKFRTMTVGVDDSAHRAYIEQTMDSGSTVGKNGLYKLEQTDCVTPAGRWLRRTSLDELPQLINVLRGEMSLVGPRPCIPYETEHFAPHHFERFQVPAGLTGLWQVTARARATFGEALDMDVAYVRGWSLGLDLRLLLKTPLQLFRPKGTA